MTPSPPDGTPRELLPITEQVLAWVAQMRPRIQFEEVRVDLDDLRRIELCALATREACYFHDLYPSPARPRRPDAPAPEVSE